MIRLFLIRHGIAEDVGPAGLGDAGRPLSAKGRERLWKTAKAFAKLPELPESLFASPLVRAVQTAEIFSRALEIPEVELLPELLPSASLEDLLQRLSLSVDKGRGVALATHDPFVSHAVARLSGLPREQAQRVQVKKGSVIRIDLHDWTLARPGVFRYWLRPRTGELLHSPPVV